MDFPCAASSCMLFTVPLLIMAAISCVDENNISHKSTALLGVGQIFYYCSPVNYNLLLTRWTTHKDAKSVIGRVCTIGTRWSKATSADARASRKALIPTLMYQKTAVPRSVAWL